MKLNTTCLGRVGYAGRWGVLMVTLASSSLATATTLSVTAQVQDATCDIIIPQAGTPLMLGHFIADDFSRHRGTAATAAFQVKVESCSGTTTATPALKVTGSTLTSNTRVFNVDPNGTAGFMIRAEKFSEPLEKFYSPTDSVESGSDSYDGSASLIKDGELDYTVGFVAPGLILGGDGQKPGVGDVSARVQFEFYYH